jgi:hypothetical protein
VSIRDIFPRILQLGAVLSPAPLLDTKRLPHIDLDPVGAEIEVRCGTSRARSLLQRQMRSDSDSAKDQGSSLVLV